MLHPKDTKSSGYKITYANATRIVVMESEAIITFAVHHNPSNVDEGAEVQVEVAMSNHTLKALAYASLQAIDRLEETTGKVIDIGTVKSSVEEIIRAHRNERKSVP